MESGIVFGLLGPNGAGKTTAVRILTTLLHPDEGSASVAGIDVLRHPAQVRERIGLAGQYAAVDDNLTGRENLEMVGRLYHLGGHQARERARELLEEFELSYAGGRLVRTYSGGMRRRLDLAAAMVARPSVLFLDEPTTGIDPRSRIALWGTIEGLVAHGATVLLTTQYLDEADRLAEQLAVIDAGRVIAEGTPAELKAASGGERLEVHFSDPSTLDAASRALAPLSSDGPVRAEGLVLSLPLRARAGAVAEAVRRARRSGSHGRRPRGRHPHARRRVPAADRARRRGTGGAGMTASQSIADTLVLARRSLLRIPRQPDLLVGFTVQPIMFVLLFVYVFGGAISTPGVSYVNYLIPGIIIQSMTFGGFVTALGLAEDLKKGLIDRFRSLPMSRAAVLTGRTLADLVTNSFQLVVMLAGRTRRRVPLRDRVASHRRGDRPLAARRLRVLVGVRADRADRVVTGGSERLRLHDLFPVTFVSSAFVPVQSMPSWLQPVADNNPFTNMVNAARSLFIGTPAGNQIWLAVVWALAIAAVFSVLAVWRYRHTVGT